MPFILSSSHFAQDKIMYIMFAVWLLNPALISKAPKAWIPQYSVTITTKFTVAVKRIEVKFSISKQCKLTS